MTVKGRLISTGVACLLLLLIGLGGLYFLSGGNAAKAERLAEPLGFLFGLIMAIVIGSIWLPVIVKALQPRGITRKERARFSGNQKNAASKPKQDEG